MTGLPMKKLSLSYLHRPEPRPRDICFVCGRPAMIVPGHIVCDRCHGRMGPCSRRVDGVTCGFDQTKAVA